MVLRVSIRFVMLTLKVRGFETAHPLFFANVPRANSSEEMRVEKEQVVHPREKKGGSEGGSGEFVSKVEWLRKRLSVRLKDD